MTQHPAPRFIDGGSGPLRSVSIHPGDRVIHGSGLEEETT
jgi:hypothetical protein